MQTTTVAALKAHKTLALAALACLAFTLLSETVLHLPLKLPGHRALPGALGLILMAQVATPAVLLAVAAVLPLFLTAAGHAGPLMFVPFVGLAVALWALHAERVRRPLLWLTLAGMLFGLLRFGVLPLGLHHTPDLVRLGGHLLFGGLGGLIAGWMGQGTRGKETAE